MTLDDLVPPSVTAAVAAHGLHKIAGAMLGAPELTIKEALQSIGAKAYLRRKEARSIADGIAALAVLRGEKVAMNPETMALLSRSVVPALAGAGVGALAGGEGHRTEGALAGGALGGFGSAAIGHAMRPPPMPENLRKHIGELLLNMHPDLVKGLANSAQ